MAEADYLKYISASFYQMVEHAWKQNKIAKQHYIFISFPQLHPDTVFVTDKQIWSSVINQKYNFSSSSIPRFCQILVLPPLFFPVETVKSFK